MLTLAEELIKNNIMSASDKVESETVEQIPNTQLSRKITETVSSVSVGSKYTVRYSYVSAASSPSWGAMSDLVETVEEI